MILASSPRRLPRRAEVRVMVRLTCVVACLWGLAAAPAWAQPEALLLFGFEPGCVSGCGSTIMRVAPDTPAVLSSAVDRAGQIVLSPYVTPEGRWLVRALDAGTSGSVRLAVRDLVTGVTQTLTAQGRLEFGNPFRPELYLNDPNGVFSLGLHGTRRYGGAECALSYAVGASGDGRRLFMNCQGSPTVPAGTRVFDVDSGHVVGVLPPIVIGEPNVDGSVVYGAEQITGPPRLQRFDVATGMLTAEVPIPASPVSPAGTVYDVFFDRDRNRVLVVTGEAVQAFDATTLARVAWSDPVTGPALSEWIVGVSFDDVESRLYAVRGSSASPSYIYTVFDTTLLRQTLTVPDVPLGQFVALRKPRPPAALGSQVVASSVVLSWSPGGSPAAVTRYILEAGSAPGLSDIIGGLDLGLQTSFGATGVPPGRYYVRVRAGNYTGLGAPSNEVVVLVP
jgi:hypothetical protein